MVDRRGLTALNAMLEEEIITVLKDLYIKHDIEDAVRFPMPWDTSKSSGFNEQKIDQIYMLLKHLAVRGGFKIRVKPNFYRIQHEAGILLHDAEFRVWYGWDDFPADKRLAADLFYITAVDLNKFLSLIDTQQQPGDGFQSTNLQRPQYYLQGDSLIRVTDKKEDVIAKLRDGLLPHRLLHYIFSKPKGRVISIRELQNEDALNLTTVSSFTNAFRSLKLSEEDRSHMFEVLSRSEVQLRK